MHSTWRGRRYGGSVHELMEVLCIFLGVLFIGAMFELLRAVERLLDSVPLSTLEKYGHKNEAPARRSSGLQSKSSF
jgi:hypothetical protein